MKRIFQWPILLLSGAVALNMLSGCSSASKTDVGLLTKGVLKVGCEIGYPPFEFFADDGVTPIGLDIDLGKAVADELGVKWEPENTAWDGIFAGLDANKYDVIISAVTISPDRQANMNFSTPYIENWQSLAVKKGASPVTSMAGLNGLSVGYQQATTSDEYLKSLIATGEIQCTTNEYDKILNAFDDLRLGRIDVVLSDSTVADGYIAREPDNFEITWIQSSEPGAAAETFGIAVKKGNQKLQEAINQALKTLNDSGKLDEIRSSWLS